MFNGYSKGLFMTTEEIHDHARQYSKTYNNPKGKWKLDPESMEKKTVLRLLLVRWGDLGEAGNAFVEDEILNGDYHDELIAVQNDESEEPKRTQAQNLSELGFDVGDNGKQTEPLAPPQADEIVTTEVEAEAEYTTDMPTDIVWPDEVVNHLIGCNLGVKQPDSMREVLSRSKMATPETPRRMLEMYVSFYMQARKAKKDETASADDADHKIANLLAAE
jgi:hypothetical protein